MTTYRPGDRLSTPVDIAADAAEALADKRPNGWKAWGRWPSVRIEAVIEYLDDDETEEAIELKEHMLEELDQRDHEHRTRINNGGVLP